MKHGELTANILTWIGEGIVLQIDLLDALFSSGYGASFSKMQRRVTTLQNERERKSAERKQRHAFQSLLYHLKEEGFIRMNDKKNKKSGFFITEKGGRYLKKLEKKVGQQIEKQPYEKIEDAQLNIILFDIPEPERKKREWLRQELNYLGFTMLQRSVWAGKIKIPKEMLEDMERYNLLSYIEIIAVTKTGTLKKLI